jgi:hypothetical protein
MDRPADHLDKVMEERRLDLDLEWNDVATAAQISPANLRSIRKGKTQPQPLTARRIERVFGWKAGSFDAVKAGGEPTLADEESKPTPEPSLHELAEQMKTLRLEVERLREQDRRRDEEIERLRKRESS